MLVTWRCNQSMQPMETENYARTSPPEALTSNTGAFPLPLRFWRRFAQSVSLCFRELLLLLLVVPLARQCSNRLMPICEGGAGTALAFARAATTTAAYHRCCYCYCYYHHYRWPLFSYFYCLLLAAISRRLRQKLGRYNMVLHFMGREATRSETCRMQNAVKFVVAKLQGGVSDISNHIIVLFVQSKPNISRILRAIFSAIFKKVVSANKIALR